MDDRIPFGYGRVVKDLGIHVLYVLAVPEKPEICKVGIADNPFKRFGSIQSSNWSELKLYRHWWTNGRLLSVRVEQAVLDELSPMKLRGEWFSVLPETAAACIVEHAAKMDIKLLEEPEIRKFVAKAFPPL